MNGGAYDVVVVGAGPAGCVAARYAALGGASVLVVDRKRDVGVPVQCGGFLPHPPKLREVLPRVEGFDELFAYPRDCVLNTSGRQRFYAPSGEWKEVEVPADTVDRRRFDKYLAQQAVRAGAELALATTVTAVRGGEVRTVGTDGRRAYAAKVVVGADGPASVVARHAGLNPGWGAMSLSAAVEYELCGVEHDQEVAELYFGRNWSPGGYAWVIPLGWDRANVGVGVRRPFFTEGFGPREYLHRFINEHPIASPKFRRSQATARIVGLVPCGGALPRTAGEGVLLCGDAGGFVMATSGGGIPFAMASGKIAGETAAEYLRGKCHLGDYEHRWREQFGRELRVSVAVRRIVDSLMRSDALMNAVIKVLSAEQMEGLQKGTLSEATKRVLTGIYRPPR